MSFLEGRFYTKEELEAMLTAQEAPLLGFVPFLKSELAEEDVLDAPLPLPIMGQWNSPYLTYYEQLRSNLSRIGDRGAKVILMSSSAHQEGKTLTTYNLAIAAAYAGKRTLIIEADLRQGSQVEVLGISPHLGHRIQPLRYYGCPSDCICPTPNVENLYVIPSLGPHPQPVSILESSEIRTLLKDCRGRFDLVLIDAPPLTLYNDALLIEPLVDGVMVVTRPGHTRTKALKDTLTHIEINEIPFLGAVINGADVPVEAPPEDPELAYGSSFAIGLGHSHNGHSHNGRSHNDQGSAVEVYERTLVN